MSSKNADMSTARGPITPELEAEFAAIAEGLGAELVHATFQGGALRLFIDRQQGGVTLADCETVSKQVSALLDVVDFGAKRYVLEVSSPGLDRQLFRPKDYVRFLGHAVRVTYRDPNSGNKKTVVGRLVDFRERAGDASKVTIDVTEGREQRLELRFADIEATRLEIEL